MVGRDGELADSLDEMSVRQLKVMLDEYCSQIADEHSRLIGERWRELNDR